MLEVRYAAMKLLELAGFPNPVDAEFSAGAGAFLEVLKVGSDWDSEDAPSLNPETTKTATIGGYRVMLDGSAPIAWLGLAMESDVVASVKVKVSPGCTRKAALAFPNEPEINATEDVPATEIPSAMEDPKPKRGRKPK